MKKNFLETYKKTGGIEVASVLLKYISDNPELSNATIEEALEKTGKELLYVQEEGRIYENILYLNWHKKYLQSLNIERKKDSELKEETIENINYNRHI